MSKIQAIILAGGKGSRLRPYTTVLPKPLVPVGGYPIAEIIVRQLKRNGLKNIVMATGYLSELIKAYFGNGKRLGVNISYVYEARPLGTAGAIRLVKAIADHFLVINGDTLTDLNFNKLIQAHKKKNAMATISIKERLVKTDFGVIRCNAKNVFQDYIEKPVHRSDVSTGINVFSKECQQYIKRNESIGMPELMLRLKESDEKIVCYKMKDIWLDLGRTDDLEKAQELFDKNKRKFLKM